jgi:acyl carrier protein
MSDNLLPELAKLIAESLRLEPDKAEGITEETTLESLGISSLELVEILMTIEEEYDLHIGVDAVEARDSLNTVGDLLKLGKEYGLGKASESKDS